MSSGRTSKSSSPNEPSPLGRSPNTLEVAPIEYEAHRRSTSTGASSTASPTRPLISPGAGSPRKEKGGADRMMSLKTVEWHSGSQLNLLNEQAPPAYEASANSIALGSIATQPQAVNGQVLNGEALSSGPRANEEAPPPASMIQLVRFYLFEGAFGIADVVSSILFAIEAGTMTVCEKLNPTQLRWFSNEVLSALAGIAASSGIITLLVTYFAAWRLYQSHPKPRLSMRRFIPLILSRINGGVDKVNGERSREDRLVFAAHVANFFLQICIEWPLAYYRSMASGELGNDVIKLALSSLTLSRYLALYICLCLFGFGSSVRRPAFVIFCFFSIGTGLVYTSGLLGMLGYNINISRYEFQSNWVQVCFQSSSRPSLPWSLTCTNTTVGQYGCRLPALDNLRWIGDVNSTVGIELTAAEVNGHLAPLADSNRFNYRILSGRLCNFNVSSVDAIFHTRSLDWNFQSPSFRQNASALAENNWMRETDKLTPVGNPFGMLVVATVGNRTSGNGTFASYVYALSPSNKRREIIHSCRIYSRMYN